MLRQRRFIKQILVGLLITLGLVASSCRQPPPPPAYTGKIRIVTTVGMLTDVVQEIVGDLGEVEGIIGAGIDPHLYKPTANDIKKIADADLVLYVGHHLEGKMGEVLEQTKKKGKAVHAVAEEIIDADEYLIEGDPHLWMDVRGWTRVVAATREILMDFDPDRAKTYLANSEAYLDELNTLDKYAQKCFKTIPNQKRVLVTAHDAFGYLGRAYKINVRGIQGISTESEAGLKDIEELIDFIVQKKIPAVFVESSVSKKNVQALIEGAHAKGHDLRIGGELYSDAMGEAGTYRGTYIGMLDHNITVITRTLGGETHESGMQGLLTP